MAASRRRRTWRITLSGQRRDRRVFSRDLDIDDDGDGELDTDSADIEFHTDIDVTFTLAGATDGGLVYGASIDLDESDGSDVGEDNRPTNPAVDDPLTPDVDESLNPTVTIPGSQGASPAFTPERQGGEEIFISGGFGRLTMGDTDGALDWAMTEVLVSSGSLADNEEHAGYNGNSGLDGRYDGQILRYDYTFGDFGVAVSGEIDDNEGDDDQDPVLGVGFRGAFDLAGNALTFGLGYQTGDDDDEAYGFSVGGTFFGLGVRFNYSDVDRAGDPYDHYGIGIGYNSGPLSLHANYGEYDFDDGSDADGFGVTAGYELGDDIRVQFGYGNSDLRNNDNDQDTFSFGVAMSF